MHLSNWSNAAWVAIHTEKNDALKPNAAPAARLGVCLCSALIKSSTESAIAPNAAAEAISPVVIETPVLIISLIFLPANCPVFCEALALYFTSTSDCLSLSR